MKHPKIINCPNCGKQNTWTTENQFKPFCSDRCKLIDLGDWASENRRIPGKSIADDLTVATDNDPDNLND
ncbi:MAG: DNA gyrase inhibitor YacG [Tatlockia sp.]|nr:DNA gyrase inhibitor YacG [Tatlockia sp.]